MLHKTDKLDQFLCGLVKIARRSHEITVLHIALEQAMNFAWPDFATFPKFDHRLDVVEAKHKRWRNHTDDLRKVTTPSLGHGARWFALTATPTNCRDYAAANADHAGLCDSAPYTHFSGGLTHQQDDSLLNLISTRVVFVTELMVFITERAVFISLGLKAR